MDHPSSFRRLVAAGPAQVFAHLPAEAATWGWANCGLVLHEDRALLVDTPYTPALTERMLARIEQRLPGTRVDQVVITHANGDHCWGLPALPADVPVIATEATAHAFCHEPSPERVVALLERTDPASELGGYLRANFPFDFAEARLRTPDRTFSGTSSLRVGATEVRLIEAGAGHSAGDLLVHVPELTTVYAGDVLFVGHHPVTWASLTGAIAALDTLLGLAAGIIVPGHGPVCGPAEAERMRGYFELLGAHAERSHARGLSPLEAARRFVPPAFAAGWRLPERMVVTIAAHYRELDGDRAAPDMIALMADCARYAASAPALPGPRPADTAPALAERPR
ncbi:MBL fold metallo-hydrolase [Kitasatospora sp. NPDC052896]|uniref:MBL fold metallo-hydrolase n=1 Tax=Kitasatospora sp. NPDC052896 TaxID=3364061 RepID=UPI0037C8BD03